MKDFKQSLKDMVLFQLTDLLVIKSNLLNEYYYNNGNVNEVIQEINAINQELNNRIKETKYHGN